MLQKVAKMFLYLLAELHSFANYGRQLHKLLLSPKTAFWTLYDRAYSCPRDWRIYQHSGREWGSSLKPYKHHNIEGFKRSPIMPKGVSLSEIRSHLFQLDGIDPFIVWRRKKKKRWSNMKQQPLSDATICNFLFSLTLLFFLFPPTF